MDPIELYDAHTIDYIYKDIGSIYRVRPTDIRHRDVTYNVLIQQILTFILCFLVRYYQREHQQSI